VAFKQEVNVPLVVTIGIISGILILVSVIGTQAWYQSEEENQIAIVSHEADERPAPENWLKGIQEKGKAAIDGQPHWVDQKNGVVAIPVSEAMDYLSKNGGTLPATRPTANNP
jgi:hypothetical protein